MDISQILTPELVGALASAILAILTAFLGYGVRYVKMYLVSKMSAEQWAFAKAFATSAVKFLEQSPAFSGEEGAHKKALAVAYLLQAADAAGIPLDEEQADKLIEEAVFDMKGIVYEALEIQEGA